MNSTDTSSSVVDVTKGQTVCRDSGWQDVARFFLLNYGLHVFTILLWPGISARDGLLPRITSLINPLVGILLAIDAIMGLAQREPDDLHAALKADALCMVVPASEAFGLERVKVRTTIHGQFPATVFANGNETESDTETTDRLCLCTVPASFTVVPPIGPSAVSLHLSSNYSLLAALAGMVQVLSGSIGLYHASERDIPHFGYAAGSLTVIPYLFMSVINLIGRMCVPEYPTMFLVRYGGPIAPAESFAEDDGVRLLPLRDDRTERSFESGSWIEPELGGTVGVAYGDLSNIPDQTPRSRLGFYILLLLVAIVPFVVIAALTGFRSANSTVAQRTWTLLWLVSGPVGMILIVLATDMDTFLYDTEQEIVVQGYGWWAAAVVVCAAVVSTIGGFVVVAQMILQEKMCIRI